MQKYQGNSTNAPRETFIGDQRHMLAYINPFEEDLLRNYGGTGQKGPGGVPAFRPVKGKDSRGKPSAGTGFSGGSSSSNTALEIPAAMAGGNNNNSVAATTMNEPNRPLVGIRQWWWQANVNRINE
jgi:hypothetical protein